MKYIHTFEQVNDDLKILLYNFLKKVTPPEIEIRNHYFDRYDKDINRNENGSAIALKSFDSRKNMSYRTDVKVLVIDICPVNDKQLRKERHKTKMKITIISYDLINLNQSDFINELTVFIEEILKKYSYFYKRTPTYRNGKISVNDYFINTFDIENIKNDLEEFDTWSTAKKYNL